MSDQKLYLLYVVLFVVGLRLWAMDGMSPSGFTHSCSIRARSVSASTTKPLYYIACGVGPYSITTSLDDTLWVLKKTDYPEKEKDRRRCKEYLRSRKLLDKPQSLFRHVLYFYFFESESDSVVRSGSYRWTYPRGLMLQKPEPVFCACLNHEATEQKDDPAILAQKVSTSIAEGHPVLLVLQCSTLTNDSAYVAWKNVVHQAESMSEEDKEQLGKKFNPLLRAWSTCRLVATLSKELPGDLFQIALLHDDYDLVAYMLQHKMKLEGTTFFARSVPMLELLDQYGVVDHKDHHDNTPFHHFAEHGRLLNPAVIDFYEKLGVDPLAANTTQRTPLGVLAHYSYRFDGFESRLQRFIRFLMQKGARGSDLDQGTNTTVFELAQETDKKWQLPATALLVKALQD